MSTIAARGSPDVAPRRGGGADRNCASTWLANIGTPVALDIAPRLLARPTRVDLVTWNLAVGRARVEELLDELRERHGVGRAGGPPLVMLLQEAYRADSSVPAAASSAAHGGAIQPARPDDIIEISRRLGLSLRYAPSMRNGRPASDRGNAILSTAAIAHDELLPLPIVRQLRIAVAASLHSLPGVWFTSAHLDVGGPPPGRGKAWAFGAGRAAQADALAAQVVARAQGRCVVLGADLNTHAGRFDPALRALRRHGFSAARRSAGRGHTFHGPLRLPLDHVLVRSPGGHLRIIESIRIGACGAWPGTRVLGSDHHPLLARLEIHEPE